MPVILTKYKSHSQPKSQQKQQGRESNEGEHLYLSTVCRKRVTWLAIRRKRAPWLQFSSVSPYAAQILGMMQLITIGFGIEQNISTSSLQWSSDLAADDVR